MRTRLCLKRYRCQAASAAASPRCGGFSASLPSATGERSNAHIYLYLCIYLYLYWRTHRQLMHALVFVNLAAHDIESEQKRSSGRARITAVRLDVRHGALAPRGLPAPARPQRPQRRLAHVFPCPGEAAAARPAQLAAPHLLCGWPDQAHAVGARWRQAQRRELSVCKITAATIT